MTRALPLMPGCLAAILISLSTAAQAGSAGAWPTADCSKARDPSRCEARLKAGEACKDKRRADRRQCLEEQLPPPDCRKATYPERCAATVAAREACRAKPGPEQRQCLREQLKPAQPARKSLRQ